MASRFSTGLVNKVLDTGSLDSVLPAFFVDVYSGTQPTDANDAPTGVKLCTLYSNGTSNPLSWNAAAVGGVLGKNSGETWSTTVTQAGIAGWFRVRLAGDSNTSSTTDPRIDGAIGVSGAEINLASTNLALNAPLTLSSFTVTLPRS